ncbi:hypothetical protein YW3DRAFT_03944 [Streptomyces sp. MnatMP-M77]|nr:hypothetical protein YW3DRAFT_03944 [Streptomyces sp. MnatMP-M77]
MGKPPRVTSSRGLSVYPPARVKVEKTITRQDVCGAPEERQGASSSTFTRSLAAA